MTENNNKPIAQFREGSISAAVWANQERRDGIAKTRYSIRIRKQFRKNGSWQTTDNYFPEELGELESVVDQVAAFFAKKGSENGEKTVPVQE